MRRCRLDKALPDEVHTRSLAIKLAQIAWTYLRYKNR